MKTVNAKEIAKIINGELIGNEDVVVSEVASLKNATSNSVSFLGNKKYQDQLATTEAAIVLIPQELAHLTSEKTTYIVCENVDRAFSAVIMIFAPAPYVYPAEIHKTASVAPTAKIGKNVHIGANATVDENAEIGDNTCICANSYVGVEVKIGQDTIIYPNATILDRCILGNKVVIHSGAVIGADGFGFYPTANGLAKIPQTGIVRIDDDVEVGANTTIDRARFGATWIKSNVKIDDQVMIGHNAIVGESTILIAQCGIAGSAEIGRGVIVAAKAGINGHITIGDKCQVAGTSGVVKSLPPNSIAMGTPAEGQKDFMMRMTLPSRFEKLKKQVADLKKQIEELSKSDA